MELDLTVIKYDNNGLVPAIVQEVGSGKVLMLAYMNKESLQHTVQTGYTWFWSRSRQELWNKGATSGNVQKVVDIAYDCDGDALLVKVQQTGNACHTGEHSCFYRTLWKADNLPAVVRPVNEVLNELYEIIQQKRVSGGEKSYTKYLFTAGQDKILKKVGEETAETIIASKNNSANEIIYEMSDLWYHCLVLLAYHNISPLQLMSELSSRRAKENNSKY